TTTPHGTPRRTPTLLLSRPGKEPSQLEDSGAPLRSSQHNQTHRVHPALPPPTGHPIAEARLITPCPSLVGPWRSPATGECGRLPRRFRRQGSGCLVQI